MFDMKIFGAEYDHERKEEATADDDPGGWSACSEELFGDVGCGHSCDSHIELVGGDVFLLFVLLEEDFDSFGGNNWD